MSRNHRFVSRRRFLQTGAAAAAAPLFVPAHVLGRQAPREALRIGVIGAGRMGTGDLKAVMNRGLDAAIHALDHTLAAARARGAALMFALASSLRASILLLRGDIRDGEADAREGLEAAPAGMWARLPCLAMVIEAL